jgi:hypothetical protein
MTKAQRRSSGNDRNYEIVRRLFPEAESFVFENSGGGFVSFPILMRKVLKYLKPKQLELLVYLWLRSDRYGLCYPDLDTIAYELGHLNKTRLKKTLGELEVEFCLIKTRSDQGRTYFMVGDPRHSLAKLGREGKAAQIDVEEANGLLAQLRLPPIVKG